MKQRSDFAGTRRLGLEQLEERALLSIVEWPPTGPAGVTLPLDPMAVDVSSPGTIQAGEANAGDGTPDEGPRVTASDPVPDTVLAVDTSQIRVELDRPLDRSSAENLSNYELIASNHDGWFGDGDDVPMPMDAAVYDAGSLSVTLLLNQGTALPIDTFQFRIRGTGGVTDESGNPLDGEWPGSDPGFPSGDGVAGGDFVISFAVAEPSPKPAAPNGVGSLAQYEDRIGEPAVLLEDHNVQMWVPLAHVEHSLVIFRYLAAGYDELSTIFGGHDLSTKFSVEHYPPGSPYSWGGTDARGTIRYGYANLVDDSPEWNNYGVPHMVGYYEEMAHCFIGDTGADHFYEALGMIIGGETALRAAWNPHVEQSVADGYATYQQTTEYYLAHDQGPPGVADNIWPTRVLAHAFKAEIVDQHGWDAVGRAFEAMRTDGYPLRRYASGHKWGAFLDYAALVTRPTVQNAFAGYGLPIFCWAGETGYATDGVEAIDDGTSYRYRIRCFDREGNQPSEVTLYLYSDSGPGATTHSMTLAGGDASSGWVYEKTVDATVGSLHYAFGARDGNHDVFEAIGSPTTPRRTTNAASTLWIIGEQDQSQGEFNRDPHTDPEVIDYAVGDPWSTFPYGLGTDIGNQRSVVNIEFEGDLPAGGTFVVGWSPGGSVAWESFRVELDGQWIGDSESLQGQMPYPWVTTRFDVPPLPQGSHVIKLIHSKQLGLGGDGLLFDFLALEQLQSPSPRLLEISPAPACVSSDVSLITLAFDRAMDPATIVSDHFALISSSGDGIFGNGNDEEIPLQVAAYDPVTYEVAIAPQVPLHSDTYRFTVSDAVSGASGLPLDGDFAELGNTHDLPSGDGLPGGNFVCRFDVLDPAAVYWMIGTPNDGGGEFDPLIEDDPPVVDFTVGSPDSEFPCHLGTDVGDHANVIHIHFEGELLSGGSFVIGWTPGGSVSAEQFHVELDAEPIGDSDSRVGHVPDRWGTSRFLIPPLEQGQHIMTLERLTGDGLNFDFLALQQYSEGVIYAAAQGGTVLVSIPANPPYEPTTIGHMGVSMFDIALSPGGQLYGATPYALYRIDPTDGRSFYVGGFSQGGVNALDFAPDGTLYAATWNGDFLTIDPATGGSSRRGSLPGGRGSGGDLAYQVGGAYAGKLLFADAGGELGWIDPSDGTGGMIGDTGYDSVYGLDDLGQTLFAFGNSFQGAHLFRVNRDTGAGEPVRTYTDLGSVYGIACHVGETSNTAPTAEPQSLSTPEDTPLPIVLTGDDPDGDPLEFRIWADARHGSLSGAGDQWSYTPDPDFYGTDRFQFTAFDGSATSLPAEVTIDVTPVNDAPVAYDSDVTVWLGESVEICLPAQDIDDPTSALSHTVVDLPPAGALEPITGDLRVTYTALQPGADGFRWYADDGHAADHQSNTATVSITVLELPDLRPLPEEFQAPDSVDIGERFDVAWTVVNDGPGTPGAGSIIDAVYLSDDAQLDGEDTRLEWVRNWHPDQVGPGETYSREVSVTTPVQNVRTGSHYLLLSVDDTDRQREGNENNNVIAREITIRPSIDLTAPFPSRFVDPEMPVRFAWSDLNDAYSAEIALAIDDDGDPGNGYAYLVQAVPEDPDGADDEIELTLDGVAPGDYVVWAEMIDPDDTYSSDPVPLRVFEYAAVSEHSSATANQGSYVVQGVEAGIVDGRLHFRVRTNYAPDGGTDVYINVGGTHDSGTGRVFGIPVVDHGCSGGQLTAGALYVDAAFSGGACRPRYPVRIQSWQDVIDGQSSISCSRPDHGGWRAEITGSVSLAALNAPAGTSIQIGWGMWCANDWDDVIIPIEGLDIAVLDVEYSIHQSAEPGRVADWYALVGNTGTEPITDPWTITWYLSTDTQYSGDDVQIGDPQVVDEDLDSTEVIEVQYPGGQVPPTTPEPNFYYVLARVTPLPDEERLDNNEAYNADTIWIDYVEPDDDEENDSWDQATDLGDFGERPRLAGRTIDEMDQSDWYCFTMASQGSQADHLSVTFDWEKGDLELELYRDESGSLQFVGSSTGLEHDMHAVSLADEPEGTYYARVFAAEHDVSPEYELKTALDIAVPYYNQDQSEWCWAVSTSMLLEYYGYDHKPWEVAADFDKAVDEGIISLRSVESYLEDFYDGGSDDAWEVDTCFTGGGLKDKLVDVVGTGRPVVVARSGHHAFVVLGFDGTGPTDHVILHDPGLNSAEFPGKTIHHEMRWDDFEAAIGWWWLPVGLTEVLYANPGVFTANETPATIQLRHETGARFCHSDDQYYELRYVWDGEEPYHGYRFQPNEAGQGYYHVDVDGVRYDHVGYSATPADTLIVFPYLANNADGTLYAQPELRVFGEDSTGHPVATLVASERIEVEAHHTADESDTEDLIPALALSELEVGQSYTAMLVLMGTYEPSGELSPMATCVFHFCLEDRGAMSFIGDVEYEDAQGDTQPAANVLVEVWEDNTIPQLFPLVTGYTDETGHFEIVTAGTDNPVYNVDDGVGESGTRDVYFRIVAANQYGFATSLMGDMWITEQHTTLTDTDVAQTQYLLESPVVIDSSMTISGDATVWGIPGSLYRSGDWLEKRGLEVRQPVAVKYPVSGAPQYFDGLLDYICLPSGFADLAQAVVHEYGHAEHAWLRRDSSIIGLPNLPEGEEPTGEEAPGGVHRHNSESSLGFAFSEGWADFFASIVCADPENPVPPGWDYETNEYWMGRDSNGGLPDGVNEDGNSGAIVEGAISSIFWDVFDIRGAEDDDGLADPIEVSSSGQPIEPFHLLWFIITNMGEDGRTPIDNVNDFYLRWRWFAFPSEDPDDPSTWGDPDDPNTWDVNSWEEFIRPLPALERIYVDHGIRQVGNYVFDDDYDTGANDNDEVSEPAALDLSAGIQLEGLISTDEDWYRLDLPAGTVDPVTVRIAFNHDQGNLDLQLISAGMSGQVSEIVAQASSGDGSPQFEQEQVVFTPEPGKTYYARVYGFGRNCVWGEDRYGEGYHPDFSPWYDLHVSVGNSAPTALNTVVEVTEDGSTEFMLNVIDDGPLDLVSCYLTSLPQHGALYDGTAALGAGTALPPGHRTIRYDPGPNYYGDDSFTFRVTDGQAWSDEAPVQITVLAVNDQPTAHDDVGPDADEDHSATFDVLANDEDIDGDTLAVGDIDIFSDLGAWVTTGPDGTVTYDPRTSSQLQALRAGQSRVDAFSYTATDGHGGADTASVTILVVGVNDSPAEIHVSNTMVVENEPVGTVVGSLSTTDPDAGDAFTYLLVPGAGSDDNASFAIVGDQLQTAESFDFEARSSYAIRVRSADQGGLWTETSFTMSVTDVNEPPEVSLANTTTTLPEDTNTTSRIKVADVVVTDDALGTNTLSLSGPDASWFEVEPVSGTGGFAAALYLKAGATLDFQTHPVLDVTVRVDDPTVGVTPDDTADLAISVVPVLEGTAENDVFEFVAGPPGSWTVNLNGVPHYFGPEARGLKFNGLEGQDTAMIAGTDSDETFELWPSTGLCTLNGYTVSVFSVEEIEVYSGGGSDIASLYDDPLGDDIFAAWPQIARFQGDGFNNQVHDFPEVQAWATVGQPDVALLYDSDANDTFYGGPSSPEGTVFRGTTLAGQSFANSVDGFPYVHAYSRTGGSDVASLYDNPATADWLKAWPQCVIFSGSGFYDRVLDFEEVHATATPAMQDVAQLYDSLGTDTFEGTPEYGRLQGSGFDNWAESFRYVHAYSRKGGSDTANLYDNPATADSLRAWPQCVIFSGAGFYDRVLDFEEVHAAATPGKQDVAQLYDSDADDNFYGDPSSPEGTVFVGTTLAGQSFANSVDGFPYVHAYSRTGGSDAAYLYDNPATADSLRAWPQCVIFTGAGFYDRVLDFEQVHATATPGKQDVAQLYDSDANDTFYGGPRSPQGTLFQGTTLAGRSFANSVEAFRYVHAYSSSGGTDQAYLFDSTTNDRFEAWSQMARVYGADFYCRALDFEQGQAFAFVNDDYDEAWEREPTLWEAVGDWEGGNMTPIPLSIRSSQSSWLEEAWAAWAAIDEADEEESKDSERNSREINPATLDWLMAQPVN